MQSIVAKQTKTCQNCKQHFIIEPEDFEFYKKIDVPAPTFCPECRLQRRLAWRNERVLYKRQCDFCHKDIIGRYAKDVPFPVYCNTCWYSDKWDPLTYGRDYDFSRPFFQQFQELLHRVPHPATIAVNAVNSDYCISGKRIKNVYLSASIVDSENVYYSYRIDASRDIFDSAYGEQLELCASVVDTEASARVFYSHYTVNSLDSLFLYDVRGANHCFLCVNKRNPKFCIFNKTHSPEDYDNMVGKYNLGSYNSLCELESQFAKFSMQFPRRFAMMNQCVHVVGNNLSNAKNCFACFNSYDTEDSKYIFAGIMGMKDCYDMCFAGISTELSYESTSCSGFHNKFGHFNWGQNLEYVYSSATSASTHLFGCVSVPSKKDYCILNKQYTKEAYEELVRKIKKHMDDMPYTDHQGRIYRYGELFPIQLSPFCYNETIAQEYFPLTKDEATNQGFTWKEPKEKRYNITKKSDDLPDHIKDVDDSILNDVIGCEHKGECNEQCSTAFRIIPQELEFYRKMNIPLPRLCPNCRHYQRLKQRNPLKLWHRKCTCRGRTSTNGVYQNIAQHFHKDNHCPNEFETSYAPNRPEIVYCENCYNSEVV